MDNPYRDMGVQELLEDFATPPPSLEAVYAGDVTEPELAFPERVWADFGTCRRVWITTTEGERLHIPTHVMNMGINAMHVVGTRMTWCFLRLALEFPEELKQFVELKEAMTDEGT
jgi:hypothetical protein